MLAEAGGFLTTLGYMSIKASVESGEDAHRANATCVQILGNLLRGQRSLLADDNYYSAAALGRQVIETTHLLDYLRRNPDRATFWMTAGDSEVRAAQDFKPWALRAALQVSGAPYSNHCALGGHPRASARDLLPGSSFAHRTLPIDGVDHQVTGADLCHADALQHARQATIAALEATDAIEPGAVSLSEDGFHSRASAFVEKFATWQSVDPLATVGPAEP